MFSPENSERSSSVLRNQAFSLMEMIIAMGILLTLGAIILPMGTRVLEMSRGAKCLSNLRQIGVAASGYIADNDGTLVPRCSNASPAIGNAKGFRAYLAPYLGGDKAAIRVFACPSDKIASKRQDYTDALKTGLTPASYGITSIYYYGINGESLPYPGFHAYAPTSEASYPASFKITAVKKPSSTIFVSDIGRPDSVTAPLKDWTESTYKLTSANFGYARTPSNWTSGDWAMYPRHAGGKINVLFYDGHAATLDLQKDLIDHPFGDPQCLYDNF